MSAPIKRGPRSAVSYRANRPRLPKPYRQAQRRQRIATHPAVASSGKPWPHQQNPVLGKRECARRMRQAAARAAA